MTVSDREQSSTDKTGEDTEYKGDLIKLKAPTPVRRQSGTGESEKTNGEKRRSR